MATIHYEEYPLNGGWFEHLDKKYDCNIAIRRDKKMILQEAENSHKDSFIFYGRDTLRADKVRVFMTEDNVPIFGMVLYLIDMKDESYSRCACGGYYPFKEGFGLMPHPFQESICW